MSITLDSIASDLHSIEIKNAAGQALAIDGGGFITANINGTVTVSATDLDIRSLLFASDSVDISGSSNVGVNATDFDIRNLVFATDKVDVSGSTIATTVDNVSTWKTSTVSASTTAGEIAAVPLTGRGKMVIQNLGSQDVFLSDTNAVAITDLKLPKGSSFEMNFEDDANVWVITASSTSTLRIAEFAA